MEWVDGVKLTDANGIRNLGEGFFVYFFKHFSSDFLVGVFFVFIGWKVRQSFPLTVISRVTTLFIGVISPVNQYQVVWLPFLLGFFQKSHDSYIPRVFAFLWVDLFFWFGKKAAFNVQMMQVRHVVFQKVIDMPPAFGQHTFVFDSRLFQWLHLYLYTYIYHIYIYTNTYAFTYTYEFLQCWYLRFHLSILHLFSARFLHHLVTCGQRIAQLTGYFLQVLDGDVFVMGRVNPQRFIGVVELLGISWGSQVFFRCRMPDSYQPIGKAAALGGLVVVKPCNKKAKHTQYFYLLWVWCIEIIYVFYIYTYLYLFAHQHGRSAFVQLMDIVTDNSHTPSICSAATVILDQYTECSRQPTVSEDTGYKTSFIHLQSPFQSLQCWLTHWILCQV